MEIEKIKASINKNYVHGAFNETNIDDFKTIFHHEFSIINIQENGTFFLFTRDLWEDVLKERKKDKDFDYENIAYLAKYKNIEFIENKASVTLDLMLGHKVIYTDFLLLTKINNEWKIVSKIYHEH
ncbi:nuclear transport factor 2 family protein [Flammeovirga sp. EKP202]|uniref:nuclear transport factor 2 family protein n=1 Tax=Flammeovirga sp. EKP202 TaxID=2770592 RepID=UPI00165FBB11|nr:nuclear transport factor 2 family protein [Flammeovirga sp. EKP202]MBD0404925.1 nuclear transport factor 2 family protein [Flammeovirga sp. EKP202]